MKKFPILVAAVAALMLSAGNAMAQEPIPAPPPPIPEPLPEPIPEPIPEPLPQDTLPPPAAAEFPAEDVVADTNTIVGRLQADGRFSMLLSALQSTGLDQELANAGPVTLFAPTDEAFNMLSPEAAMSLMEDNNKLRELLLNHVATEVIASEDVQEESEVSTMGGETVTVRSEAGTVKVEDATVVQADLSAGESVVHAVNQVIIKEEAAEPEVIPPPAVDPTIPPRR